MTDGSGSTSWAYDRQGRIIAKTQTVVATVLTVQYQYDTSGRLWKITYPDNTQLRYSYDLVDRITAVFMKPASSIMEQTLVQTVAYLPFGPVAKLDFSGYTDQDRTYDLDYRPTALNGPLARTYATDPVGNITGIAEGVSTWTYDYDNLDRLTTVTDSANTTVEDFTYWNRPASITTVNATDGSAAKRVSTTAITTVIGPVGPVIWLGVPPKTVAKKPVKIAP